MNWKQAIQDYKLYLTIERGLSKNSIDSYTRDVKKLELFLLNNDLDFTPIKIDKDIINQFIYEVAKTLNPRSQSRLISGLRNFFDYLIFEDYRKDNPTDLVEMPKIGRKLPDTLSNEEINKILEVIDLSHPQGERNKTIIETIYSCGLRVSEVINIQLSDLFFTEGFIRVLGKGDKFRFVPIHYTTQKLINSYIYNFRNHIQPKKEDKDTLFLNRRGKRLTRQMIYMTLKEFTQKAGIKKKIGPHTLRHSFATELLKRGADLRAVQQILGHESITTTEIYVHLDKTYLSGIVNTFHPRKEK